MALVLYTFWRSQAAFRVRIALRLKQLQAEMVFVDLIKSEHLATATAPSIPRCCFQH
jgi:glutathione S-transferase